jgi:hypothetical protein
MTEETAEERLARYEFVIDAYVRELAKLREENERLRSEAGAHGVLRNIYLDEAQSSGVRVKAAQAALNVEKPRLAPVEAPLELTAEPIEDLATVVQRQRARANRLLALPLEERAALITGVVRRDDGNGSDDSSSND